MMMTLVEYGSSAAASLCTRYLEGWIKGRKGRAILLHGEAGVGKTTLVEVLAEHFDLELLEMNASMDFTIEAANFAYAVSTRPLDAEHKVVFFDEVDNLTEKQQGELALIVRMTKEPTFLACNDYSAIGPALRANCVPVAVQPPPKSRLFEVARRKGMRSVEGARSYRDVEAIAAGGVVGKPPDEFRKRIEAVLKGALPPEVIRPTEFWAVSAWIADNVGRREAARFDSYVRTGTWGQKYAYEVLRRARARAVRFPWSVGVGRGEPAKHAPTRKEGPAKAPPVKTTAKPSSATVKNAEEWFG